jgi:hypothetical protein
MATVLNKTEARQGTGRGRILMILIISLSLAALAGLLLAMWFGLLGSSVG